MMNRRKFLGLLAAAPLAAKIPAPVRPKSITVRFTKSAVIMAPGWHIDREVFTAHYLKCLAENRKLLGIERWNK